MNEALCGGEGALSETYLAEDVEDAHWINGGSDSSQGKLPIQIQILINIYKECIIFLSWNSWNSTWGSREDHIKKRGETNGDEPRGNPFYRNESMNERLLSNKQFVIRRSRFHKTHCKLAAYIGTEFCPFSWFRRVCRSQTQTHMSVQTHTDSPNKYECFLCNLRLMLHHISLPLNCRRYATCKKKKNVRPDVNT